VNSTRAHRLLPRGFIDNKHQQTQNLFSNASRANDANRRVLLSGSQPTQKSSRLAQFTPVLKGQLILGTDDTATLKTASQSVRG
jgi:hypothetical protein